MKHLPQAETKDSGKILQFLAPKLSPYPLSRIGGKRDGSYLVPDDLKGISSAFSPGVANRKDFEDELWHRFAIPSHMADFSSDPSQFETPLIEGAQTFEKKWVGAKDDSDTLTLDRWISERDSSPNSDLLLQMDIEGAEYETLQGVSDFTLQRFRVVVVELHKVWTHLSSDSDDDPLSMLVRRLQKFFVVVHAHPNNCCSHKTLPGMSVRVPEVLELTLFRIDRFPGRVAPTKGVSKIPHPLDISRNSHLDRPIFLGNGWYEKPRSIHSKWKIFVDYAIYFLWPTVILGRIRIALNRNTK